jgi:hypothetical protein
MFPGDPLCVSQEFIIGRREKFRCGKGTTTLFHHGDRTDLTAFLLSCHIEKKHKP